MYRMYLVEWRIPVTAVPFQLHQPNNRARKPVLPNDLKPTLYTSTFIVSLLHHRQLFVVLPNLIVYQTCDLPWPTNGPWLCAFAKQLPPLILIPAVDPSNRSRLCTSTAFPTLPHNDRRTATDSNHSERVPWTNNGFLRALLPRSAGVWSRRCPVGWTDVISQRTDSQRTTEVWRTRKDRVRSCHSFSFIRCENERGKRIEWKTLGSQLWTGWGLEKLPLISALHLHGWMGRNWQLQ